MATNFPGSVDNASTVGDGTHPSADELLSSTDGGPAHHALHQNVGLAINAIEDKVGTGASTPVVGSVLTGTGSGTSEWSTDPLYVDATNDRVGIGTTTPESILHLNPGTDQTPDGNGVGHIMIDGSGYTSFLTMDGTGTWVGNNSNNRAVVLATDETARLTVGGTGLVGIGTSPIANRMLAVATSSASVAPLELRNSADLGANSVSGMLVKLGSDADNPGTNDYYALFRKGNAVNVGSISGNGSGGIAFNTTSDATLKTSNGVVTAERTGAILDGLIVHDFDWIDGYSDQIGLFAQEAIDYLPAPIVTEPSVDAETEMYQPAMLDYSAIVPILIAECQFLRQRVAALEAA